MTRVSWNRDEDGVVVLYVTDAQGRVAPAADLWLQPLIDRLGLTRAEALAMQELIAETVSGALVERLENLRVAVSEGKRP